MSLGFKIIVYVAFGSHSVRTGKQDLNKIALEP